MHFHALHTAQRQLTRSTLQCAVMVHCYAIREVSPLIGREGVQAGALATCGVHGGKVVWAGTPVRTAHVSTGLPYLGLPYLTTYHAPARSPIRTLLQGGPLQAYRIREEGCATSGP